MSDDERGVLSEQARLQDAIDASNARELDRTLEIARDALRLTTRPTSRRFPAASATSRSTTDAREPPAPLVASPPGIGRDAARSATADGAQPAATRPANPPAAMRGTAACAKLPR